ncbi:hypothetical protein MTO96_008121 [Rhipicephalus appendiculatus]
MLTEWQMLLLACAIILLSWLKSQQLTRKQNPPPGTQLPPVPPLSSLIGHLELLDPVLYKKAVKLAKEYGPVFSSIPKNSAIRSDFNGVLRRFLEVFGVLDVLDFVPRFLQQALGYLPFTSIYKGQVLMKELDEFIIKEIIEKSHENPDDAGENFLQLFREKIRASYHSLDPMLEYQSLVGNVKSLIGAGVVTASSSLLFHLANFAAHPDTLQDRVQREIDEVIGPDREPTWKDRTRMPFTLACIYEAERCGRRSCPGESYALMMIFLMVTYLLQRYHVVNDEPLPFDCEEDFGAYDLKKLKIRFIPRCSTKD